MKKNPTVELKLPILKDMELVATHTSDVVAKYMNLSEEKAAEISMALIEACINAFEHSETKEDIFIHFIISDEKLTIKVIDKGVGFDASSIELPNIDKKITEERKRGWGLMLIKELMDKVDYESDNTWGSTRPDGHTPAPWLFKAHHKNTRIVWDRHHDIILNENHDDNRKLN